MNKPVELRIIHYTVKLSPSDKPYFNALHDAAYKQGKNMWFKIGISLNIMSVFDLDSIRKNNPSDVGECFSAMLQKWFQSSPDCHLDTFLKALRSEPVELENLCPKVEEAILKIAFPDQKNLGKINRKISYYYRDGNNVLT